MPLRAPASARSRHSVTPRPTGVQGVWSRALGLPIERPKSVTMKVLEDKFGTPA